MRAGRAAVTGLAAALVLWLIPAVRSAAHGTEYEVLSSGLVGVRAAFEGGVPMGDARVLIFAPGDPEVYYETRTDRDGVVCFRPDALGMWVVQVRAEGGHGLRVNLEVDESLRLVSQEGSRSRLSAVQRIVMAASVLWGMAGTALYFRRKAVR